MLIDTHCHLEQKNYDQDREAVVARAVEEGVGRMLTVATNRNDCEKVISIAERFEQVYCALGIHPHDSEEVTEDVLDRLKKQAAHPKVLAIGEIGLDYFKNYAPHDVQRKAFDMQLDLAKELKKPIIIHDREAHGDILDMLEAKKHAPYKGVFHCFSGDVGNAKRVLDLGFHLSFTGTITYKKEVRSHEVLKMAPWDRVMVETDCPFLTPMPYRGRRQNEPAYVRFVAEKMAEIWGAAFVQVEQFTTDTAYRLFGFEKAVR